MPWDPEHYLAFADDRGRPFFDLLARVGAIAPRTVVDLGCGPGNLTRTLLQRWPGVQVIGVDASQEMISAAESGPTEDRLAWVHADLRDWQPAEPVDVIVSNAALQWVHDYGAVMPHLVELVGSDGWLAIQVPNNHNEPLHQILREVSALPQFASHLQGLSRTAILPGQQLGDQLMDLGLEVDVWDTTYLHRLQGTDPVFDWISGTGARPTLDALTGPLRDEFVSVYSARLREAYPAGPHGTWLPFPRSFVVAHRA